MAVHNNGTAEVHLWLVWH